MKTEEKIVLEYVKKQSLLEEEHRQAAAAGGGSGVPKVKDGTEVKKTKEESEYKDRESEADAEALRRAIEESMRGGSGPSGNS